MAGRSIQDVYINIIGRVTDLATADMEKEIEKTVNVSIARLARLQDAARDVLKPLRDFGGLAPDLGGTSLQRELQAVQDDIDGIARRIQGIKDEDISVNFEPFQLKLQNAFELLGRLQRRIEDSAVGELNVDATPLLEKLDASQDKLAAVRKDVEALAKRALDLSPEQALQEIDALDARLKALLAEVAGATTGIGTKVAGPANSARAALAGVIGDLNEIRARITGVADTSVDINTDVAEAELQKLSERLQAVLDNVRRLQAANPDVDFSGMISALERLQEEITKTAEKETVIEKVEVFTKAQGEAIDYATTLARVQVAADDATESVVALAKKSEKSLKVDAGSFTIQTRLAENSVKALANQLDLVDGHKLNIDVTKTLEGLEAAKKRFQTLKESIDSTAGTESARKAANAAKNRLSDLIREIELAQAKLRALDDMHIEIDFGGKGPGGGVVPPSFTSGVSAFSEGIGKATSQVDRFESAFGNAFRRLLAFGFFQQITQGFTQIIRQGIAAAGEIQNVTVALNRFFVGAGRNLGQTSQEFIGNLKALALETPFEFKGLAETSRRLLAMGQNADQTIATMSALSDAVAAVGGTQGDIDGVVRAITQLASKGRVDLQDFRQISEHLPSLSRQMQIKGVIDELNELHPGLNATVGDFDKLRKSGLITGKVLGEGVIRALKDIPGAAGAARAASANLQGALSNLRDFVNIELADSFKEAGRLLSSELVSAFGSQTGGAPDTPLAASVEALADSVGRAVSGALPELLGLVQQLAPSVADVVSAVGELAEEAMPLLENAGKGALGSFTGLTKLLTGLVNLLDTVLPGALQETIGGFFTLATVIPGAGEALSGGFTGIATTLSKTRDLAKINTDAMKFGLDEATVAAQKTELSLKQAAAASQIKVAVITGAALLALNGLLSAMAEQQAAADRWAASVKNVSRAFEDLGSSGEGTLAFINELVKSGEKIQNQQSGLNNFIDDVKGVVSLGGLLPDAASLAGPLDVLQNKAEALSATELRDGLHTTETGLAKVVELLARAGAVDIQDSSIAQLSEIFSRGLGDQGIADLKKLGVSLEDVESLSGDAKDSLHSLAKQVEEGAALTVAAAGADKNFALVQDDVIEAVQRRQKAGENALALQDELKAAQNAAAAAAVDALKASAPPGLVDQIVESHTKMELGVDGVTRANVDMVAVMLDVQNVLRQQDDAFDGLVETFGGFGDTINAIIEPTGSLSEDLVNFAVAADKAGFKTDEFNAVANKLGTAMSDLTDGPLSGAELEKISGGITKMVEEAKGGLDKLIQGIDDMQNEADGFSLDSFLTELSQLAIGRLKTVANVNTLIDRFGKLGADAIAALGKANVSKEQFSIILDQVLKKGGAQAEKTLHEIIDNVGTATEGGLKELAQRLVENRLTRETIEEMLGSNAFEDAVSNINADGEKAFEKINFKPAIDMLQAQTDALHEKLINSVGLTEQERGELRKKFDESSKALFEASAGFTPRATMLKGAIDVLKDRLLKEGALTPTDFSRLTELSKQLFEEVASGGAAGAKLAATQVPGVDVEKAKAQATTAGEQIGTALSTSVQTAVQTNMPAATGAVQQQIDESTPSLLTAGVGAGKTVGDGLTVGVVSRVPGISLVLSAAVASAGTKGADAALAVGAAMSFNFVTGFSPVKAHMSNIFSDMEFTARTHEAALGGDMASLAANANDSFTKELDDLAASFSNELQLTLLVAQVERAAFSFAGATLAGEFVQAFDKGFALSGVISDELNAALEAIGNFMLLFHGSGAQIGSEIAAGIKEGIAASTMQIAAAAADAVKAAEDAAKAQADAHSPSKVFAAIGRDLGAGLVRGMASAAPAVARAGAGMAGAAASGAQQGGTTDNSTTHNHTWNVQVPADDPEMFTRRAADRLERRLS